MAGRETGSPLKGRLLMGMGRCVAKEVYRVSLAPLPSSESFVVSQSTYMYSVIITVTSFQNSLIPCRITAEALNEVIYFATYM